MAKKAKLKDDAVYRVTMHGRYFATTQEGNIVEKPYEIECRMDKQMVDRGVHGRFRKHIAPDLMPTKYPDFSGLHTYDVKECVDESGEEIEDIRLMSRDELLNYIEEEELPINQVLYGDDSTLRDAIKDCEDDEEGFLKSQKFMEEKRSDEIQSKLKAKELNSPEALNQPPSKPVAAGASGGKQPKTPAVKGIEGL